MPAGRNRRASAVQPAPATTIVDVDLTSPVTARQGQPDASGRSVGFVDLVSAHQQKSAADLHGGKAVANSPRARNALDVVDLTTDDALRQNRVDKVSQADIGQLDRSWTDVNLLDLARPHKRRKQQGQEVQVIGQTEPELPPTLHCSLCLEDHRREECFTASMCGHALCKEGARTVVLLAIGSCSFPILCPVCLAKPSPPCCKCQLRLASHEAASPSSRRASPTQEQWCCHLDGDLQTLLKPDELDDAARKSLKCAVNRSNDLVACPVVDCPGVAVAGRDKKLVCGMCENQWCSACQVNWHEGMRCKQFRVKAQEKEKQRLQDLEQDLAQVNEDDRTIVCPGCSNGLQKSFGCNRIQCTVCRSQVCWLCSAKLPQQDPYSHYRHQGPCFDRTYQ